MKYEIKKEIERILAMNKLSFIQMILFGSRARNNYTPESDWDIVIVVKEKLNSLERKKLWTMIYKALHRKFPKSSFDIFIKSEDEFEIEKNFANTIANEASTEGIFL